MQPRTVEQRLTILEQQMQDMRELPARIERVESQILQLRTEMKDGVAAIRSDLRAELHGVENGLRTELHDVRDTLRSEIREVRDELKGEIRELRDDIRIGVEESQNLTKGLDAALRRDVVSRLDRLLELRPPDTGE